MCTKLDVLQKCFRHIEVDPERSRLGLNCSGSVLRCPGSGALAGRSYPASARHNRDLPSRCSIPSAWELGRTCGWTCLAVYHVPGVPRQVWLTRGGGLRCLQGVTELVLGKLSYFLSKQWPRSCAKQFSVIHGMLSHLKKTEKQSHRS